MRLLVIALLALVSLIPLLMVSTNVCGLNNDAGAVVSVILGWILLPVILLHVWKGKPNPAVMAVDVDDPIMQAHIARATAQLPRFIDGLQRAESAAYIKFPYVFDGEIEHVWGVAHAYQDGAFVTSLASAPVGALPETLPPRLRIPAAEIEDWTLTNAHGQTQGGYTMLATALIYEQRYGKLPKHYADELRHFVDFTWPQPLHQV